MAAGSPASIEWMTAPRSSALRRRLCRGAACVHRANALCATSVDGVLTGRGADLIIIDDPLKPDEALSDTTRVKVNDWYDNTAFSRLNSKQRASVLLIMQRLHEDDLTGHLASR